MSSLKGKIALAMKMRQEAADLAASVKQEPMGNNDCIVKREEEQLVKMEPEPLVKLEQENIPSIPRRMATRQTFSHKPSMPKKVMSPERTPSRNIIKNYSRALTTFALSSMALSYLETIIQREGSILTLKDFLDFVKENKKRVNCIKNLREMLLVSPYDDKKIACMKKVFKKICEIFLKFFSVNWIYNSKISDKMMHMKYRFKMLRRVRNPEFFTYLEGFTS